MNFTASVLRQAGLCQQSARLRMVVVLGFSYAGGLGSGGNETDPRNKTGRAADGDDSEAAHPKRQSQPRSPLTESAFSSH